MTVAEPVIQDQSPRFRWLTPTVCRVIFVLMVAYHFYSGWRFLHLSPAPLDLSGDEAQYWTWSRQLALSYYSKGPLIAYVIRLSCAIFGQTMPAVRLPALVLAVGTSLCAYWITRKLFKSDRLALGAYLLGALVPMYTAGSLLMTIDPLLYFCWALACCFIVVALFDEKRWGWIAAGVIIGIGFLAKYAALLWLPGVLLFMAVDSPSRKWLRTPWPWAMVGVSLVFSVPVIVWNAQHGWVSLHHVATQTGANDTGGLSRGNLIPFLGAQLGILNPFVAICLIGAVLRCIRGSTRQPWSRLRGRDETIHSSEPVSTFEDPHPNPLPEYREREPEFRAQRLLLYIGGFYFLVVALDALRSKVQPNWPAPAYFTLLILTAHFIATASRRWRPVVIGAIVFGLAVQPILTDATLLYPIVTWVNQKYPRAGKPRLAPANVDFEYKLRGVAELGTRVGEELTHLPNAFVMCEDYQDAAQMQFYVPGQPRTFFAGSYWTDPAVRRRFTQVDMWPDRDLSQPSLRGRDCIYLGTMAYAPLRQSFDHVEQLPDCQIFRRGLLVRTTQIWKCIGFHGMTRPVDEGNF